MSQERSFEEWMARLRAGDEDAATEVFNRFARRLLALARSRLDSRLRQKVDPEDVLQSACQSFFSGCNRGEYQLESWDSLWAMLTVITVRKCRRWVERYHAQSRDVGMETSPSATEDDSLQWQALAREPSPAEALMMAETIDLLMRGLNEPDRVVLNLRLQGFTILEISAMTCRSDRTVKRVMERLRERLEQMREEEEAEERNNCRRKPDQAARN